jgi:hypothetical protein
MSRIIQKVFTGHWSWKNWNLCVCKIRIVTKFNFYIYFFAITSYWAFKILISIIKTFIPARGRRATTYISNFYFISYGNFITTSTNLGFYIEIRRLCSTSN